MLKMLDGFSAGTAVKTARFSPDFPLLCGNRENAVQIVENRPGFLARNPT
jgi:hypothetical protein